MAMPIQKSAQHPSTRRYSVEEKAQAVRLVRQLRAEWGTDHGTVKRVAGTARLWHGVGAGLGASGRHRRRRAAGNDDWGP